MAVLGGPLDYKEDDKHPFDFTYDSVHPGLKNPAMGDYHISVPLVWQPFQSKEDRISEQQMGPPNPNGSEYRSRDGTHQSMRAPINPNDPKYYY